MNFPIDKKVVLTGTVLAIVVVLITGIAFAGWGTAIINGLSLTQPSPTQVSPSTYTQGLTVNFKLNDPTAGALVTADVKAVFFASGAAPLSSTTTDSSITSAAYSSPVWQATLDQGTYVMLVSDTNTGSEVFYPSLSTVVVPGTNTTNSLTGDTVVTLQPAVTQLVERATPAMSGSVNAYDPATRLYSIDVTKTLDFSYGTTGDDNYTKWQVTEPIQIAGVQGQTLASGRIYLPVITGIAYNTATINGVAAGLQSDLLGTVDGVNGQYVSFNNLAAGQTVTFQFNVQKVGIGPSATSTSMIITVYDDYACQNTDYRWWTPASDTLTLVPDT